MGLTCQHDLEHPIQLGRACYVCRFCGEDITLHLVFLRDAENETEKMEQEQ